MRAARRQHPGRLEPDTGVGAGNQEAPAALVGDVIGRESAAHRPLPLFPGPPPSDQHRLRDRRKTRSEEHTSELQSLMRISYAVFCLKKKIYVKYNLLTIYWI